MTQTKWLGVALLVAGALGAAACDQGGDSSASAQSLGQKCVKDADCNAGESCVAQICVPAPPQLPADLGVTFCKATSDCQTGEICAHGVCLPQHIGGATLCDKDADCGATEQCLAQVCVPKLPTGPGLPFDLGVLGGIGQSCMQTSDCTGTLECALNLCLPVDACKVDADCATGKHCATQAGICF
jgi:hypothetical protein